MFCKFATEVFEYMAAKAVVRKIVKLNCNTKNDEDSQIYCVAGGVGYGASRMPGEQVASFA